MDIDSAVHWRSLTDISEPSGHPKARLQCRSHDDGRTDLMPLHHAAQDGDFQNIQSRASVYEPYTNLKDKNGRTPLHLAASSGHVDIVKWLIGKLGADPNTPDSNGWMPLHMATANGHLEVV
jgi:ankyrin repeat protein